MTTPELNGDNFHPQRTIEFLTQANAAQSGFEIPLGKGDKATERQLAASALNLVNLLVSYPDYASRRIDEEYGSYAHTGDINSLVRALIARLEGRSDDAIVNQKIVPQKEALNVGRTKYFSALARIASMMAYEEIRDISLEGVPALGDTIDWMEGEGKISKGNANGLKLVFFESARAKIRQRDPQTQRLAASLTKATRSDLNLRARTPKRFGSKVAEQGADETETPLTIGLNYVRTISGPQRERRTKFSYLGDSIERLAQDVHKRDFPMRGLDEVLRHVNQHVSYVLPLLYDDQPQDQTT